MVKTTWVFKKIELATAESANGEIDWNNEEFEFCNICWIFLMRGEPVNN